MHTWHDSFMWFIHTCYMTHSSVTWRIQLTWCYVTCAHYVDMLWHASSDSKQKVEPLSSSLQVDKSACRFATFSCVWHDSSIRDMTHSNMTRHITNSRCRYVTHSCVWHDTFTYEMTYDVLMIQLLQRLRAFLLCVCARVCVCLHVCVCVCVCVCVVICVYICKSVC